MAARTNVEQKPASPPVRVEIRVAGRIKFANDCYDVDLQQADDVLKLTAALHPTMVDVAPARPPERFGEDPREGTEVIHQVHSGSRKRPAATKEEGKP
jgi:hypothetical protein